MRDMNLERAVAQLMQKIERRFYGKYRGFVVDNDDPEKLGRLKVKVPSVLGSTVVTGWALPCMPYAGGANQGMLFIPEQDAGVWIEFEEGDLEFPVWVGAFWSKPDGNSELPTPNDDAGTEEEIPEGPATRKIIKTLKGHTIQFEDKDGEEMIRIVQQTDQEHKKCNVITLNADGITVLQSIEDGKKNLIEMTATGIKLTDFTGNILDMNDSAVTLTSKVDFTIDATGKNVEIKASAVKLTKA
jgi:uncharacterized protein involved in type VI secretion and phage assembly